MGKIAWVMTPPEMPYYQPVIDCLRSESIDIFIGAPVVGGKISPQRLQSLKYDFVLNDAHDILQYSCAVVSRSFLYGKLKDISATKIRCVVLTHAVDAPLMSDSFPAHWYIAASQRQVEMTESGKFIRSQQPALVEKLLSLPAGLRNEYAYTGPYHLGEWLEKRHRPKALLQRELEDFLGCAFDGGKPVVAFLQDEFCHEQQLVDGLTRLSKHVNLLVKGSSPLSSLSGVFAYPHASFAPNLLRFAADYILAGYHSGTLASSTMLGLPVIPYYTSMVFLGGRTKGKRARHTVYLERQSNGNNIALDILELLNPPVNLQDTKNILARIYSEDWWTGYRLRLPTVQKKVFGDYDIDNASQKTAQLIRRVFSEGTFGEDTAAVRLRPEAGRIVKVGARQKGMPE